MAWEILFPGGQREACIGVEHRVRVDEAAHLLVYPEARTLPREAYVRGASFELDGDGNTLALTVMGLVRTALGLAICAAVEDDREQDPASTPASVLVHQRRRGESLAIFLDRLAAPRRFQEVGDRESVEDVDGAIPVGACVASFAGETVAATSARALAAIVAGSNTAMGQARALADTAWRLLTFNRLDDARTDHVYALSDDIDWRLDESGPDTGLADCVVLANADIEPQWPALEALFNSDSAMVEIAPGLAVPTLPMSVSWAGESFFAAEVSVFFRSPGDNVKLAQTNVDIRMKLVREPRPARAGAATAPRQGTLLLLGRVRGKPAPEDAVRLLEVEPAAPEDAEGQELAALVDWRSGDGQPLQVIQPAPGYARRNTSAFYARWTAGDLILVEVTPGSLPIGLGAPRRHVPEFEQAGAAELALRGKGILHRTDGESQSALMLHPDGNASIAAPSSLALAEGVTVTPDLVSVARNTRVSGNLDVD